MAVQAENFVEELFAEPVHDRKHDNKRGHAQHDADHGKDGNDGHRPLLAACAQIAEGEQPLEWRKRPCAPCRLMSHPLPRAFVLAGLGAAGALAATSPVVTPVAPALIPKL